MALLVCIAAGCGGSESKPTKQNALGLTPFHMVAREGDLDAVKQYLEDGVAADVRDVDGNTALHRAARDGKLAIAQILLDYRADPDAKTATGWTPLHLAIRSDQTEMVELLLRYSADPNIPNPQGEPPLHVAVEKDDEPMVRHLLTEWPSWKLEKRQQEDGTEEYVRVETGTHQANINAVDSEGRTALHVALAAGNHAMASTLLAYNPDLSIADKDKNLPIHLAAESAPIYLIRSLIDHGSPMNQKNDAGKSPVEIAYERGDRDIYELIYTRAAG